MKHMRTAGRVNLLALGVITMVALMIAAFVFAREEPGSVGAQFMSALAKHDVEKLVDLSYTGGSTPEEVSKTKEKLKKEWDFAVNTAGKYYTFAWRITASTKASDSHASVTCQVQRNVITGSSYDEKYELPLEMEGGKWKVDVKGINAEMFPGLPR